MRALTLVAALAFVAATGCEPFADEGESCVEVPCALGLLCVDGACERQEGSDGGEGRCEEDEDCALEGSADGRRCREGECVWAECSFDVQCGARICDEGLCAPREACTSHEECDEGRVCDDGACRSACGGDDECSGFFQACGDDGRCRQQCLGDFLCFGGLCEGGVCVDPECADDGDCAQAGNWFCNQGRCESFLPCDDDGDCFDPNFRCSDLGRCEERPLCERDEQCGLEALCIDRHCRPTVSCLVDEDACASGQECVAGRCVNAPTCRSNAECGPEQVCARGSCRAEVLAEAGHVVVETGLGPCVEGSGLPGASACTLVLFRGEQAPVRFGALDEEGAPVRAALEASVGGAATLALSESTREGALLMAVAPGDGGALEVTAGEASTSLPVIVVPTAPEGSLHVLVIDEGSGAPVAGATVTAGGATATTSAEGLAVFSPAPSSEPALITAREGTRGLAVADLVPMGDFRLALPAAPAESSGAAGARARITSSGDELGPVGLGLALPSVDRLSNVGAAALFGPTFIGTLEVPLLGAIPLPLPAAATLTATLPLVGTTADVRPIAYVTTAAGPRSITAFEGRSELDALFALVGAGDDVELLLDLAEGAEAMDVLTRHVGVLESAPLVPDEGDLDGDGSSTEPRPDFDAFPSVEITPTSSPNERVGLALGPVPLGARERVFVVAGLLPPGYGFVPTGISALALDDGAPRQVKVAPPILDGLTGARRAIVVEALFDDGRQSRLLSTGEAFGPAHDLGTLLTPPTAANILDGVPLPGDRLLLLPEAPSATTYRVTLDGAGARWHLYLPAGEGGRSVQVDAALGGPSSSLGPLAVMRFDGANPHEATLARFVAGSGPLSPSEEAARAFAQAP